MTFSGVDYTPYAIFNKMDAVRLLNGKKQKGLERYPQERQLGDYDVIMKVDQFNKFNVFLTIKNGTNGGLLKFIDIYFPYFVVR